MNKEYYPLFTKIKSIPLDLNLYLEDINNMNDIEFQEYAEKLRKYVIYVYENHNFPACIIKGRSLDNIIKNFRLFDSNDFSDILYKGNIIRSSDKTFSGINHWFPEMFDVKRQSSKLSTMDAFREPKLFYNSIFRLIKKDALNFRKKNRLLQMADVLSGFRILNGVLPITNFPAGVAKLFFSKILNKDKFKNEKELFLLDQSCGWGGRMMGALSSVTQGLIQKPLHYNGTDVNTAVHDRFPKIIEFWKNHINDNNIENFNFYKSVIPAEKLLEDDYFSKKENTYNMSFTSPPYFNTEHYSKDETQSFRQYTEYEQWSKYFLKEMLKNTHKLLKRGGECFINIADVKRGTSKEYYPLQADTLKYAEELGFQYKGVFKMILATISGIGTDVNRNRVIGPNLVEIDGKFNKFEPIFYFIKR